MVLPPRLDPASQVTGPSHGVQAERAIGHAHIQVLPHPALLPGNHRRQQAHHGVQRTARHIRQLYAQGQWAGVLAPGMAGHAGQRQVVDIVPGAVLIGAGLAVAGDRHIDQPRVDRLQRLIAQAQARHDTGAELLEQDVMALDQLTHNLQRLGLLEVQGQAALVAIEVGVAGRGATIMGRQHTQQVHPRGRFDTQHLGAHVRQHQGGKRAGQQGGKIQHFKGRQGT